MFKLKNVLYFSLILQSKMPKGKKAAKGNEVAPTLAVMKKQEAKKVPNPI